MSAKTPSPGNFAGGGPSFFLRLLGRSRVAELQAGDARFQQRLSVVHKALRLRVHRRELPPAAADHQAEGVQIHLPAAAVRRAGHDPREGVVYLLKGDAVALQAAVAVVERAPPDPEGAGLVRRQVVLREREVIYLLPGGV